MNNFTFRLVGVTDAAGKYKEGAPRDGNEDAMFVDLDLAGTAEISTTPDSPVTPGDMGMLMVVADGMGGMNAGEVASQIAVDTVRAAFLPSALSEEIAASPESRARYMEDVIRKANLNIINDAAKNKQRYGMGSTIIMAWIMPNGEMTLSWIGDSRAYLYNRKLGLRPLSEDHSLVQQLVRKGLITYEQSFNHPQSNVILRSLGDTTQECAPETRQFHIGKGDIVMLCSDGLSGMLRDRSGKDPLTGKPYEGKSLQEIISENSDSLAKCREELWKAAESAGWYDNVTAILCSVTNGPDSRAASEIASFEKELAAEIKSSKAGRNENGPSAKTRRLICAAIFILAVIAGIAWWMLASTPGSEDIKGSAGVTNNVEAVASQDVASDEPAVSPGVKDTRTPSAETKKNSGQTSKSTEAAPNRKAEEANKLKQPTSTPEQKMSKSQLLKKEGDDKGGIDLTEKNKGEASHSDATE